MFNWVNQIPEFSFNDNGVHFEKEKLEELIEKKYPVFSEENTFIKNFTDCLTTGTFLN